MYKIYIVEDDKGIAEGIKIDRNLEVYTSLPNDRKDYSNAEAILSTLIQNVSRQKMLVKVHMESL